MSAIRKMAKDMLTDQSNVTFDAIKVLAVGTIAVALGLQVYSVLFGKPFDCQSFGIGMAAVFVAVGGALKLTSPTSGVTATQTTTSTVTESAP